MTFHYYLRLKKDINPVNVPILNSLCCILGTGFPKTTKTIGIIAFFWGCGAISAGCRYQKIGELSEICSVGISQANKTQKAEGLSQFPNTINIRLRELIGILIIKFFR
jgi:hypothetical protein